jgi:hypothetical protein
MNRYGKGLLEIHLNDRDRSSFSPGSIEVRGIRKREHKEDKRYHHVERKTLSMNLN